MAKRDPKWAIYSSANELGKPITFRGTKEQAEDCLRISRKWAREGVTFRLEQVS